jgi:exopolyphosphatase/guanosine-5'-triphosphate,3'-diphosphate pyrophosphatase
MRDSTVAQFRRRYQVEGDQVERVESTALSALAQLEGGEPSEGDIKFLSWASRLHEIGISVAHNAYHKHGAYILTYADMPGFSKKDQARLAMIVLGHRGKLEKMGPVVTVDSIWHLIFCLRLAVLLHRTRDDRLLPAWRVRPFGSGFMLELPSDWLAANPWTAAALSDEAAVWQRIGRDYLLVKVENAKAVE